MESDDTVISAFAHHTTAGAPDSPLGRYALASSLFGKVDSALKANCNLFLQVLQSEDFQKVNKPTQADIAAFAGDLEKQSRAAMGNFDLASSLVILRRAATLPHLGRCIRELQSALQARSDFDAAKVLLAQIFEYADKENEARKLLEELLAAKPDSTSIRIRLSEWAPLDKAQDLMEAVPLQDANQLRVMLHRATLERDAGDYKACCAQALAIIRVHGNYWGVYEMLGQALEKTSDAQSAWECLEYSSKFGRTAEGLLCLARLGDRLGKPGVVESLIDAWRAAPNSSKAETDARDLLRHHDTAKYVCQRCGGGGTISETSGSMGEYGSIQTRQVTCPQSQGFGFWHPKVR